LTPVVPLAIRLDDNINASDRPVRSHVEQDALALAAAKVSRSTSRPSASAPAENGSPAKSLGVTARGLSSLALAEERIRKQQEKKLRESHESS
jgi:hypothetical protein